MLRVLSFIHRTNLKSIQNASLKSSKLYDKIGFLACEGIHGIKFCRQINTNSIDLPEFEFKIQKHNRINLIGDSTIKESNIELNDLILNVAGEKLEFNLTWLRDSCHCNQCTHQHSRQRLFTPKDFRRDLFDIREVRLVKKSHNLEEHHVPYRAGDSTGELLQIRWSDGHNSSYSLNWLRNVNNLYKESQLKLELYHRIIFNYPEDNCYFASRRNIVVPEKWSVSCIKSRLIPIKYAELFDEFRVDQEETTYINANKISLMTTKRYEAMRSLISQLVTFGLAKVVDVPTERNEVLKVARSLTYERPTGYGVVFDVVVEPSEEINLAYSSQEFDLHSDLTYRETSPGVQLLHCIRNSTEGGLSYFSDASYAAKLLQQSEPILFEVLLQFPITFTVRDPYRDMHFRIQRPVLTLDYQGNISDIYYSPFTLPPIGYKNDIKLFYLAIDKFTRLLQSEESKFIAKMDPGDLFIFHNRRVLHGRSAYNATSSSSRFLQGCYMDWDEISCLNEKLNSRIDK